MLKLTNTLTGHKEFFVPQTSRKISLYVCGVTPYDDAHIGHGRCYVTFDMLYRLLRFLGFEVCYCRNFTDIDDKLLNKAEREYGDRHLYGKVASHFISRYHEDMQALGCKSPSFEPRVTEHISEIVEFIQSLIAQNHAYVINGDVYFHVPSFSLYPRLSKHDIHELQAGERVAIDKKKKNPLDFALWKSEPEGEFWQSPWGWGRPGWHIECSALAHRYLGETIDIHAGGMDLIFPHHDNEIAQSESRFKKDFARFWLHNAFVRINQEKMSKSLGNAWSLRDIFARFEPVVVRFYLLNHHYRAPLDFSFDDLEIARKTYQKLCRFFENVAPLKVVHELNAFDVTALTSGRIAIVERMLDFLLDDMNSVGMFGVLFEKLSSLKNTDLDAQIAKVFLQQVVGLPLEPLANKEQEITPKIKRLIAERNEARANRNWQRADAIRAELLALGFEVQDKK